MLEWVDCVRNKLEDMGILNPKGNLYSKTPLITSPSKGRNPMSPLPSPPVHDQSTPQIPSTLPTTESGVNGSRNRLSIVDASDQSNQSFTTSIYLNQTPPATPQVANNSSIKSPNKSAQKLQVNLGARPKVTSTLTLDNNLDTKSSYETIALAPTTATVTSTSSTTPTTPTSANNSSVYLNTKASHTRHVTVIPINKKAEKEKENNPPPTEANRDNVYTEIGSAESQQQVNQALNASNNVTTSAQPIVYRRRSPSRRQRPLSLAEDQQGKLRFSRHEEFTAARSPPKSGDKKVARRYSDRKQVNESANKGYNIQQRIRKKSQRSSSLGPLLDEHNIALAHSKSANTNSLESIDSNPRQAASHAASRGAIPRRPFPPSSDQSNSQPLVGSPPRHLTTELPPGIRPPPYHPLAHPSGTSSTTAYPPHIPLPGLTCQLSLPPGVSIPPTQNSSEHHTRCLREQQVMRLRQEIGHPSGVRLMLRKRDCINSMALVEFFGCLWVSGWKQREYPVLYNAFHVGDQIVSAGGVNIRTASEFHKILKSKGTPDQQQQQQQPPLHIEIIIRRLPFAQVFHLRREVDGQPVGIVVNGSGPEINEIIPGSPASVRGMTAKVRSFDGQTFVNWVITEINGRPVNLFAKEHEVNDRLQAIGRDISVLVQPADVVQKMKKQLKSFRSYKDFVLT